MTMLSSVVLISGPPGAGKSAVARELAASSAGPTAYIEGDSFWFFIAKSLSGPGARQKNFQIVMRAMTATAQRFAREGYEAILDFSLPPWFVASTQQTLRGVPLHFVIIRPSEAVCAARAANRTEGAMPDYAPYHDLYLDFDGWETRTIADDDASAAQIAARVRAGLAQGAFLLPATQN